MDILGNTMSEVIFYQMLFTAIELATYMFAIVESKDLSLNDVTAIVGAISVLVPTFLYCKLSENVTEHLQAIETAFYGCSWYRLHVKQQKMVMLPIQRAQIEFRLNGLGIVDCSLEIFAAVNWPKCFRLIETGQK